MNYYNKQLIQNSTAASMLGINEQLGLPKKIHVDCTIALAMSSG